jgi:hypothetical protein
MQLVPQMDNLLPHRIHLFHGPASEGQNNKEKDDEN